MGGRSVGGYFGGGKGGGYQIVQRVVRGGGEAMGGGGSGWARRDEARGVEELGGAWRVVGRYG